MCFSNIHKQIKNVKVSPRGTIENILQGVKGIASEGTFISKLPID